MSEVTQDMILDYLIKKGGSVRNVDLVHHFRKFLQNESTPEKDRARGVFKERVNTVAFIKVDKQVKYLHIRPEFAPAGGVMRHPSGSIVPGSEQRISISSIGSLEDAISGREPSNRHDPQSQLYSKQTTQNYQPSIPESPLSDSDVKSSPVTAMSSPSPPVTTSTKATLPSSASKLKDIGEDDFGSSLMAEINTFGSLMDSFGLGGSKATPISSTSGKSVPVPVNVAPNPPAMSTGTNSKYGAYSSNASSASDNTLSYTSNTPSYTSNPPSHTSNTPSYTSSTPSYTTNTPLLMNNTPSYTSNTPSHTNNTPAQTAHVVSQTGHNPLGSAIGISSITRFSPPRFAANTSPSHASKGPKKSALSRGQVDMDLDLTSVLSSLPSANPSSFRKGSGKPPSGAGKPPSGLTQPSTGGPDQSRMGQSSYQNSTRLDQPSSNPASGGGYQNSTRFDQPPASSYQNSTRFDQPKPNYQNTTKFDQPKANYQNSTKFVQPTLPSQTHYQNSTKFVQPALPAQPSYQNSTSLPQPTAPLQPSSYQGGGTVPNSYQSVPPQATTAPLGFNERALAVLSTNIPQPTNPQPLPPVGPSYKRHALPPSLSALQGVPTPVTPPSPPCNTNPQPSSYEPQSMGAPSQVLTHTSVPHSMGSPAQVSTAPPVPHSIGNQSSSTAPRAPMRSSSISQATRSGSISQATRSGSISQATRSGSISQETNCSLIQESSCSLGQGTNGSISQGTSSSLSQGLSDFINQGVRNRSGSHSSVSQGKGIRRISTPKKSSPSHSSHHVPHRSAPPPPQTSNTGHAPGRTHTSSSVPGSYGHRGSAASLDHALSINNQPSSDLGIMELGDAFSSLGGGVPADGSANHTLSSDISGESDSPVLHPATHSLGPTVTLPPNRGVARPYLEDNSHRQGSLDSNPTIHVDAYPNSGGDIGVVAPAPGVVQLRNKEGKRIGPGPLFRRSKNMEKNENKTRLSICMTPPSVRKRGSSTPPDVAPKPIRPPSGYYGSQHDIRPNSLHPYPDADDTEEYENEYDDIDPLEKEWMLAGAQADLDGLYRLLMAEPLLINRKGFLHGYSAMHWAAKHGRMDILTMLLFQGGSPNIKSNGGLTPLHLAAQAGHENVLILLVTEQDANINLRENGGRRPIDMLNHKVSSDTRILLSRLNNQGFPIRIENTKKLSTFTQPHHDNQTFLDRNWGPVAEVNQEHRDRASKKKLSPRSSIKKSFSFKNKHRIRDQTPPPRNKEKRQKKLTRPASEGAAHVYDV